MRRRRECGIHTDTSGGHRLVPGVTLARVRPVDVVAVGVRAAVARRVLALVDVLVAVGAGPARVQRPARQTPDDAITLLAAADVLAVPTPPTSGAL